MLSRPVPRLCLGTSPLGSNPQIYGYSVDEDRAVATLIRALEHRPMFIDTANEYGESEIRIGEALCRVGGPPEDLVIASKADPLPGGDFSDGRVLDSFEESLKRMGLARVDIYYLHDPERFDFGELSAPDGAVQQMLRIKESGRATSIGVAGGDAELMRRFTDLGIFDVILHHNGYNLLDASAETLIDDVRAAGLAFVNAAPFASGILAKSADQHPRYRYGTPDDLTRSRTEQLRKVCERYLIPLAAVALQYSTRDPRVLSTVAGVSSPARVDQLLNNDLIEIPQSLWLQVAEIIGRLPAAICPPSTL